MKAPSFAGRASALAAAVVLCYGGARRLPSLRNAWPAADDLRDSVAEPSGDLAQRHVRLVSEPRAGCALCHIPRRTTAVKPLWGAESAANEQVGAPPDTAICLSCHDGQSRAPDGTQPGIGGAHPVGMDYRAVWAAHPDEYNPPGSSPHMRLEDGKVGCVSCHRLHGASGFGIDQEACQACHQR